MAVKCNELDSTPTVQASTEDSVLLMAIYRNHYHHHHHIGMPVVNKV